MKEEEDEVLTGRHMLALAEDITASMLHTTNVHAIDPLLTAGPLGSISEHMLLQRFLCSWFSPCWQ